MALIEVTTLGDFLLAAADKWPDRPALVTPQERVTYSELSDRARIKASALMGLGIKSRDHVGLMMPNVINTIEWLFATSLTGASAVMINARYKQHELAYVVDNAQLTCLITANCLDDHVNFLGVVTDAVPGLRTSGTQVLNLDGLPALRHVIVSGRVPGAPERLPAIIYDDQLAGLADRVEGCELWARRSAVRLRDPCLMLYTSGTTSDPKGCPLSHESVVRTAVEISRRLRMTSDDRQWNPLPFFHLASLMPMFATIWAGGTYIFSSHFDPDSAWTLIQQEKATFLYPAFPAIMTDLLAHPDFEAMDLSSIRLINNVAPPQVLRENMRKIPGAIHISAYGLTEASGLTCYSDLDDDDASRAGVIGTPLDGVQLKIVDPERGSDLPCGEKGEVLVKGFSVFGGYFRDEKKTAESLTPDGWLRTGDLGSLNERGQLSFHGRIKDTLKVGGENVSALEVESYLALHPDIKIAQVIGVPDRKLEEVVAAFIELRPGAQLSEEAVIHYCRGKIASFKVPRHIRFISDWPMSATKVKKHELRKLFDNETNLAT